MQAITETIERAVGRFKSPPPRIRLTKAFATPFANVVATARTCYSAKGIVEDDNIGPNALKIAESIYEAGHHTTYQHAHFQFAMENVSRQFLWAFLHAHPFYNSEQVSQRYVPVRPDAFLVPELTGEALAVYERAIQRQVAAYERLKTLLYPVVDAEFHRRFARSERMAKKHGSSKKKKCQEVARYVTPVACHAYLYHTISGIELMRYWRMCRQGDAPSEQALVVGQMIELLLAHDAEYAHVLQEPLPENTAIHHWNGAEPRWADAAQARRFCAEFDADLGGRVSKLIDWKARAEETLAQAVREALGATRDRLSDDDAIDLALNPARNALLGESMNVTTLDKVSRALAHPSYTFRKLLSHAADSQDQRHRMTPGSRPSLRMHLSGDPDFVTPALIRQDSGIEREYRESMEQSWEAIGKLRALGVEEEFALYLLPNAVSIRFSESADLLNLHHKHRMRLCYLAQEEIWRASVDEALQVREVHPRIGQWLRPPCGQRKAGGVKPTCPEGDRYCGVRVWMQDLTEYERVI